jgi:hypothetical protein
MTASRGSTAAVDPPPLAAAPSVSVRKKTRVRDGVRRWEMHRRFEPGAL